MEKLFLFIFSLDISLPLSRDFKRSVIFVLTVERTEPSGSFLSLASIFECLFALSPALTIAALVVAVAVAVTVFVAVAVAVVAVAVAVPSAAAVAFTFFFSAATGFRNELEFQREAIFSLAEQEFFHSFAAFGALAFSFFSTAGVFKAVDVGVDAGNDVCNEADKDADVGVDDVIEVLFGVLFKVVEMAVLILFLGSSVLSSSSLTGICLDVVTFEDESEDEEDDFIGATENEGCV